MSGGVDSAVTALLLRDAGADVLGVTIKMFDKLDKRFYPEPPIDPELDIKAAKSVAERVGIEHRVFDYSELFKKHVIDRFISSYYLGLTPNPCIVCNRYIKFGALMDASRALGYDRIATGHYARIERDANGRYLLKKATDPKKDQTYVLYSLTQKQLARTEFPLGTLTKDEVRAIAASHGFSNSNQKDSQDICFIPNGDYAEFIRRYLSVNFEEGNFIDGSGNILGRHGGAIRYTIGQRKGLGIALGQPMYVREKDMKANTVTLGLEKDLFSTSLDAESINFIPFDSLSTPIRVEAKIRYSQKTALATLEQTSDDGFHLEFDEPQRAITSGQSVVLYDGDVVIGGGVIK